MSKLTILEWCGDKREVHFVGYNRDHTACFIRDGQNARRAIALRLPTAFDLLFHENPIGKDGSPPVEINRAALHLPACFLSKEEKEKFEDPNSLEMQTARFFPDDLWKSVTRHKCCLEPKDDEKLSKLLRDKLDRLRRLQAIRAKETADQIAALPPGETKRAEQLRDALRAQFTTFAEDEDGPSNFMSIFDTTLDMVRQGWGGLRDKLLEREWAEHFGWNLKTIPTEAAAFHNWLERRAYNARQTTTHLNTRTVEIGVGLQLDPWQWATLEAAVQYEICFADGARCWLDNIEERGVTDPQEVEDFERLEAASEVAGDERMTLDEVRRSLPVKRKGESRPMSRKGLQKLCDKARVPFKFPMRRSVVKKLAEHRMRQSRNRNERLQRHAAKTKAQRPL